MTCRVPAIPKIKVQSIFPTPNLTKYVESCPRLSFDVFHTSKRVSLQEMNLKMTIKNWHQWVYIKTEGSCLANISFAQTKIGLFTVNGMYLADRFLEIYSQIYAVSFQQYSEYWTERSNELIVLPLSLAGPPWRLNSWQTLDHFINLIDCPFIYFLRTVVLLLPVGVFWQNKTKQNKKKNTHNSYLW